MLRRDLKEKLIRLMYPFGSIRRVWRGPMRGLRYFVEPGIGFTYALGIDTSHFKFPSNHIKEGMTVYDIGANRGQLALLFSRLVGENGRVVSYEPVPSIFKSLEANIKLNEIDNVSAVMSALGNREGETDFLLSTDHVCQGKMKNVEPTYSISNSEYIRVNVSTLDAQVNSGLPGPNVLKVDVEGGARDMFEGAREVLRHHKPSVYIELHGPEEQAGVRYELLSLGYLIETVFAETVLDPTHICKSPLWCYHPAAAN